MNVEECIDKPSSSYPPFSSLHFLAHRRLEYSKLLKRTHELGQSYPTIPSGRPMLYVVYCATKERFRTHYRTNDGPYTSWDCHRRAIWRGFRRCCWRRYVACSVAQPSWRSPAMIWHIVPQEMHVPELSLGPRQLGVKF